MSVFKDTNINNPGSSIRYGADDMEVIARLFNGVTTGIPPVTIKSNNKWGFWDNILYFRNQADSRNTTIRGQTNVPSSNVDLTLPPITTNDTLAAIGLTNVWGVKQQFEAGAVLKQISTPSNPSANYHHLYINGSGQLIKRNSSGAETIFTSGLSVGDISSLKDFMARVIESGGTYYAYDHEGGLITSGTTLETVAQAALDYGGNVLFHGELYFSAGFTGLTLNSYRNVYIPQGTNLYVPAGYTGYVFKVLGSECSITGSGGYINEVEAGAANNWTCIQLGSGTVSDNIWDVELSGFYVYLPGTAVEIKQGSGGIIQNVLINNIVTAGFRKGIVWTTSVSDKIKDVTVSNCKFESYGATTTNVFKDVAGTRNVFIANQLKGIVGTTSEMNITANAVETITVGGNHTGVVGTFSDSSTTTMHFNTNGGLKVRSGYLNVKNPAGTFYTTILGGAISAARNLNLPAITGTDTLAALNMQQTFTQRQTIALNSEDVIELKRTSNTVGNRVNLNLQLHDSLGNAVNYARIAAEIFDPTNTSEDGKLLFHVRIADVLANCMTIDQTGALLLGGPNTRIKFTETGLTATRTYTMPDYDGALISAGAANIFTQLQTIQYDGNDLLYLYRPLGTNNTPVELNFDLNNSVAGRVTYADIKTQIVDNTSGSEDGQFSVRVMDAGTKREMFRIDGGDIYFINMAGDPILYFDSLNSVAAQKHQAYFKPYWDDNTSGSEDGGADFGTLIAGVETDIFGFDQGGLYVSKLLRVERDASSSLLELYRTDNAVGNTVDIAFYAQSSTGVKRRYSSVFMEILDPTNASEDSFIQINNIWNGVSGNSQQFHRDGNINMIRRDSTQFAEFGLVASALNSSAAVKDYGSLTHELMDTVAGSEDGQWDFDLMRAGTTQRVMKLENNGTLRLGRDSSNMRTVVTSLANSANDIRFVNSNVENTMLSFTVKANTVGDGDSQIMLRASGYLLQNSATATTYTLRIKVGGTTIYQDAMSAAIAQSSATRPWWLELRFFASNQSQTTARMSGLFALNDASAPTTGQGSISDDESQSLACFRANNITWNFTTDVVISITIQMDQAQAATEWQMDHYDCQHTVG